MSEAKGEGTKLIATNPNARRNYFIEDVVEAGAALTGTEVKSIRAQSPNLSDAFIEIRGSAKPGGKGLEAWLLNASIAPYAHGNIWNHEPKRPRKLLLHRHQIEKLFGAITQQGLSVVPTRMYFKKGRVKVELGWGRGKKRHDKRDSVRKESEKREIARALKSDRKRG